MQTIDDVYEEWLPLGIQLPFMTFVDFKIDSDGQFVVFLSRDNPSEFISKQDHVTVVFDRFPCAFNIVNETYRDRTITCLSEQGLIGKGSFFLSKQSNFLQNFHDEGGLLSFWIDFEHLLLVTNDVMIDFIIEHRPEVHLIKNA